MSEEPVVALLAEEWQAIVDLGGGLRAEEWDLPSECPGWSVRDVLSHLVGTERALAGDPAPAPVEAPHVRNPVGAANEGWVESFRSCRGEEVLEEFRAVTTRRLLQLRSMPADAFGEIGPSPVGQVPYREFLQVRVMDCWVHEQDIRVATGRPGHSVGVVARAAFDRFASAMPYVVGKKAGAPEGSGVRFELGGSPLGAVDVEVRGGRGVLGALERPSVTLRMDAEVFWRLACGRVSGDAALAAALVGVDGDRALAERVVGAMAFMI